MHKITVQAASNAGRALLCLCVAAAALGICGCGAPPSAPEGAWEPLFNGRDLSGWETVGDGDWRVEDGAIVVTRKEGRTAASWLVAEREYADFKLRLKFQSKLAAFNSGILIRDPGRSKVGRPAFNGFEVQLLGDISDEAENPSGSIYDVARAYPRRIEPGVWTDVEIHCIGDHIVSFIGGQKMAETHSRRSFFGAVGLQLHGGGDPAEYRFKDIELMELPAAPRDRKMLAERLETAPGEFIDFLAGKTIENDFDTYWDGGASWSLRDGVLRGEGPEEISWVFAKGEYEDYILAFDYRISKGGNAGVCFRFPWPADGNTTPGPASLGFECQLSEIGKAGPSGSIYQVARAYETDLSHRPVHRPERWNECRIYVSGDQVVTYINRQKMAETHTRRSATGRIGFQAHHPAEWAEYRNVQLKVVTQSGVSR